MLAESDLAYLKAAVVLAERGLYSTTPNPRVGCLIVRDDVVIGRGWHVRAGEGHAEVNAIADAGGDVAGATVYTSLEPCAFVGRTPACAEMLVRAGVARVVSALTDPHPSVAGRGYEILRSAGIRVDCVELPEARALNRGFCQRVSSARPLVRVKLAASLDGRTAMASGESQWITGEAARADVQHWRARSCAIVTGSGTVSADDPLLTVRDPRFAVDGVLRQPLRVVATSRGDVDPDRRLFTEGGEVLIATGAGGPEGHPRANVFKTSTERVDLQALLAHLAQRGCNEVWVEAGAELAGAFIAADVWDELVVYLAPKLLGSDARPLVRLPLERMADAVTFKMIGSTTVGDDLRLVFARNPKEE